MKVNALKNSQINQNGYHKNTLTKERIGTLFIYPIDFTPNDCLSCDGYSLQINDYEDLYKVIGTKFNQSDDEEGTFRVPDYNVTGRFLQPSQNAGGLVEAGLPNITGQINVRCNFDVATGAFYSTQTSCLGHNSNYTGNGTANFNASRSSSIYGNSTTVQPPSQLVHICIKYK